MGVELEYASFERARTKRRFLETAVHTLQLPGWFGMNWDALYDSLTDLDWAARSDHLVWWTALDGFACAAPAQFAAALSVLSEVATFWSQREVRVLILLEAPARYAPLPEVACR
jgi:hypothetical protein